MPDPAILPALLRRCHARRQRIAAETAIAAVLASRIYPLGRLGTPQFWCSYCGHRIDPKPGRRFCCDRHRMAAWRLCHKEAA